jgi:hypothetical protein
MQPTGRTISVGQTLRYPTYTIATYPTVAATEVLEPDACPHQNFYWVVQRPDVPDRPIVRLERGINSMLSVVGPDRAERKPAILLRTTPYKAGTETTPWHDVLDPAAATLTYYGDMRPDLAFADAADAPGNKVLLATTALHTAATRAERVRAHPLLYFTAQQLEGRQNGHVRFEGILLIVGAEPVTQPGADGGMFSNYRFDMRLIALDDDRLPWDWIAARWDPAYGLEDALALAPTAWRQWVESASIVPASTPATPTPPAGPAKGGYATPDDADAVDAIGMEVALGVVRKAYPGQPVKAMPKNNPGFDILVGTATVPVRYVEVKSTRSLEPVFLMSEGERRFSVDNASCYELLVVTGIDVANRTHADVRRYPGAIERDRYSLRPLQWQGRAPL